MQSNIYFWGRPTQGATVAIEKEIIFLLFFEDEKQFLRGEGECSICYLNHPAINN